MTSTTLSAVPPQPRRSQNTAAFKRALAVLALLASLGGPPAYAQAPGGAAAAPTPPAQITLPEFQGVSCLVGGSMGALAAWTYGEMYLAAAAVAGSSVTLIAPIVATSFVAGCGVGSIMAPGLLWLSRHF